MAWLAGWSHRRPITLSNPGDVDHQGEPIRFTFTADQGTMQPGGADLRVTDDFDSLLEHRIVAADDTAKTYTVQVESNLVAAGATVTYHAYWGNPGAANGSVATKRTTYDPLAWGATSGLAGLHTQLWRNDNYRPDINHSYTGSLYGDDVNQRVTFDCKFPGYRDLGFTVTSVDVCSNCHINKDNLKAPNPGLSSGAPFYKFSEDDTKLTIYYSTTDSTDNPGSYRSFRWKGGYYGGAQTPEIDYYARLYTHGRLDFVRISDRGKPELTVIWGSGSSYARLDTPDFGAGYVIVLFPISFAVGSTEVNPGGSGGAITVSAVPVAAEWTTTLPSVLSSAVTVSPNAAIVTASVGQPVVIVATTARPLPAVETWGPVAPAQRPGPVTNSPAMATASMATVAPRLQTQGANVVPVPAAIPAVVGSSLSRSGPVAVASGPCTTFFALVAPQSYAGVAPRVISPPPAAAGWFTRIPAARAGLAVAIPVPCVATVSAIASTPTAATARIPGLAALTAAGTSPVVLVGRTTSAPAPATVTWAPVAPQIYLGLAPRVVLQPPASAVWFPHSAVAVAGRRTVAPVPAILPWSVMAPGASMVTIVGADPVTAGALSAPGPMSRPGAAQIRGDPVVILLVASSPMIIGGGARGTPPPILVNWAVIGPAISQSGPAGPPGRVITLRLTLSQEVYLTI